MSGPDPRGTLAQTLATLLERLCAPDLTLAEANELRPQLDRLLAAIEAAEPPPDLGDLTHPPASPREPAAGVSCC